MKQLSIEEKAKAYDEVIKKLRDFYRDYDTVSGLIDVKEELLNIFPELKESEEEKTKRLLHTIANKISQHLRDIFTEEEFQCFDAWSNAWLEKQGEKKPILDVEIPFGAKDSELEEVSYSIPNGYHAEIEDNKVVIKKGEQKPWSEDDEKNLNEALSYIQDEALKTFIKDRIQPQSQQWKPSKEQLIALRIAIGDEQGSDCGDILRSLLKDLDSL